MSNDAASTRRSFLKGGAVAAAPLAAAASVAAAAQERHKARLARLEDEAALRELHHTWLKRINTGAREEAGQLFVHPGRADFDVAVRSLAPDHAAEPETLSLAADGRTASGRFPCVAEIETPLAKDCTLAQMAHAQGDGVVLSRERRVLKAAYVKTSGVWAIAKLELEPA